MAAPVSFGDVVEAIKILNSAVHALREQDGARDEFQRLDGLLECNCKILQAVERFRTSVLPAHTQYVEAVRSQSDKIGQVATSLQNSLRTYQAKLGKSAPKRWHRDILAKGRFALVSRESLARKYSELESETRILNSYLSQLSISIGAATERSSRDAVSLIQGKIKADEQTFSELKQTSVETTALLRNLRDQARANLALPSLNSTTPSETATRILQLTNLTSTVTLQSHNRQPKGIESIQSQLRAVRKRRHPLAEVYSSDWEQSAAENDVIALQITLDMRDPVQRQLVVGLVLLLRLGDFLRNLGLLALCIIPIVQSFGFRNGMSRLLPDNFTFKDALGREFSLPIREFCGFSVLEGFLKAKFIECPGLDKVNSGDFRIFDVDNPTRDVTFTNWNTAVRARGILRMSIVISSRRITNMICVSCQTRLKTFDEANFICPNQGCGKFLRSTRHRLNLRALARIAGSFIHHEYLEVPTGVSLSLIAGIKSKRMARLFDTMLKGNAPAAPRTSGRFKALDDVEEYYHVQSQHTEVWEERPSSESSGQSDLGDAEEDRETLEEAEPDGEQMDPSEETDSQTPISDMDAQREQKEIVHFTSVSIRRDMRLYTAASSGNAGLVLDLLNLGLEVDANDGPLGTPLIPAIFSKSWQVVSILLNAGADPMATVCGDHSPISMAACYSTVRILEQVLESADRQSWRRQRTFQTAADTALFKAMDMGKRSLVPILLYVGACPLTEMADGRSAFALAISGKKRDDAVAIAYLAECWGRKLLTDNEARSLASALKGNVADLADDPWLTACCNNIAMGRAHMLSSRTQKRLAKRQFFMIGYQRYNIMDNLLGGELGGRVRLEGQVENEDGNAYTVIHQRSEPVTEEVYHAALDSKLASSATEAMLHPHAPTVIIS